MSLSSVSALFHELSIADRLTLATRTPAPWLVTGEDRLRLTVRNGATGVTVRVSGRFLTADAVIIPIAFNLTPATDFSASANDFALGDGWILNLTARITAGTPQTGQTWLVVDVVRGAGAVAVTLGTLLAQYLSASDAPAWPGSALLSSKDGAGAVSQIAGANPAAGAEWTITVPAGVRFVVQAITAVLVADATAANREVAIVFTSGGAIVSQPASGFAHTAGLTKRYSVFPGNVRGAGPAGQEGLIPMPAITLRAGDTMTSQTTNLQAGDDWDAPVAHGLCYVD